MQRPASLGAARADRFTGYDRTALGDGGGAPRRAPASPVAARPGPRDTLQYTYVGADTLLEVNPTTCRYHLRRLVRPDDAPAPAPRCTSCPGRRTRPRHTGMACGADRGRRPRGCSTRAAVQLAVLGQAAKCEQAAPDACRVSDALWRGSAAGGCYCDCDTWRWGSTACGKPAQEPCAQLETCSACVERPWCSWCSTTQSCHGGGKHKASGELCLEWHELACPKLPLELVYEQPAFARALMPCHATDSDPKAHPWDLALLETGGADC